MGGIQYEIISKEKEMIDNAIDKMIKSKKIKAIRRLGIKVEKKESEDKGIMLIFHLKTQYLFATGVLSKELKKTLKKADPEVVIYDSIF